MQESTKPHIRYEGRSEREFILDKFAEGEYQTLVAMKCLDEGVDVPAAKLQYLCPVVEIPENTFKDW